jgi:hypothetical protein
LLAAIMLAILAWIVWIGWLSSDSDKPAPNHDPALRAPAWHPDDPGVIDLRSNRMEAER